jgi:streptogramin lyase
MIHPVYDVSANPVPGTFGTVAVQWTPGTDYDQTYQVVATPTMGVSSQFTINAPFTSINCTDLLANRLYQIVVTTFITGQSSEPETYAFAFTGTVIPPTNLALTNVNISSASLAWDAPTSENLSYAIDAITYSGISQTFSGITTTQFVCSNLTSGATYYFSVYTVYKGLRSIDSINTQGILPVAPPTNLSFAQTDPTSVQLNWSASPAQVPGYQTVVYNISGTNISNSADYFYETTNPNALTYLLDDKIIPGTIYNVSITTQFEGQESEPALIQVFTITSPPTNLVALPTYGSTTSITASWTASPTLGVSYRVYVNGVARNAGTGTSYVITGLVAGTSYNIRVTALSGTNESPSTATVTATTYISPPSNLRNTSKGEYSLGFSWNGVSGSDYEIILATSGTQLTANTTATTYEFSSLLSGERYTASIRTISGDLSSYSVNFNNPFFTLVAPITNLSAYPTQDSPANSLIVDWSLSPADYGDPSNTRYNISVTPGDRVINVNGGTTMFVLSDLSPLTSYTISVVTRRPKPTSNPPRASTAVSVIASTEAQTFPEMTWLTNSYGYATQQETSPYGIIFARESFWITDSLAGDIWVISPPDAGTMTPLRVPTPFTNPRGISYTPVSPDGAPLFVAHADGVSVVSLDGQFVYQLQEATSAAWGIVTNDEGNTYVSIPTTQTIQFIDPYLNVTTYASNLGSNPEGIALATNGFLYAADPSLNAVTYADPNGSVGELLTVPGSSAVSSIVSAIDGNLYVADRGNRKIFKVTLGGAVSLFTTLSAGYAPLAITQDPSTGYLYTTHSNGTVTEIRVTLT